MNLTSILISSLVLCLGLFLQTRHVKGSFMFPGRKTWWAQQLLWDVYVAGRLTDTQIKSASEDGFKSVISIFTYTTNSSIGDEFLPDTPTSRDIATRLSGLEYAVILDPEESMPEVETVRRFTEIYFRYPKPMLLHCTSSYSATLIGLNFVANQTLYDPEWEPRMDSMAVYDRAVSIGHSLTHTELVAEITGEPEVVDPPVPDITIPDWNLNYWLIKPVYKNWYVAGQIENNYFDLIRDTGFTSIVNSRVGMTIPDDIPSQEEVTLFNIHDRTGTYDGPGRQSEERLLETRIDPDKPNEYIHSDSEVNYQARNYYQFGDDIGYNEESEQQQVEMEGFGYFHTPIDGEFGYTEEMFYEYIDTWLEAGEEFAVLSHCRTGYRGIVTALLAAGTQYDMDSEWAIERAADLGYHFENSTDPIIELFQTILG